MEKFFKEKIKWADYDVDALFEALDKIARNQKLPFWVVQNTTSLSIYDNEKGKYVGTEQGINDILESITDFESNGLTQNEIDAITKLAKFLRVEV